MAIRQIKSGKEPDNVPAEALRSDIEVTASMLHVLFSEILVGGQAPTDWKEGHLIKIPNKGDLNKRENCGDITPLPKKAKI
ncbi:unnamed protein product [Schistosoma margrebowiei]|uniref:Uncharacterized protein n=1 Tax=Schistosoma margrebowiei TaxID=48269 RepID=A0A183LWE8_9TREM|nr:unnamed protein product [Schistosoma margrebowiei]